MHEPGQFSRRTVAAAIPLSALVALPGAALAASAAIPAPASADVARIDVAVADCREARRALAAALEAYESALPPPHFTLDMTGRRPMVFDYRNERRLCDGEIPDRAKDLHAHPCARRVATEETIKQDLRKCPVADRQRRRQLYRMRRRAKVRAARVGALEASFRLDDLSGQVIAAERAVQQIAQRLFETPATSMSAVLAQAKALSSFAEALPQQWATFQAGRFGKMLADGLQHVARAA